MKALMLPLALFALLVLGCVGGRRSTESHSVSYEVSGDTGSASVTYQNGSGGTEQADINVPWTKRFTVHGGDFLYLSAQNKEESGSITARISVDGKTIKTSTSQGGFVIASASTRCCE